MFNVSVDIEIDTETENTGADLAANVIALGLDNAIGGANGVLGYDLEVMWVYSDPHGEDEEGGHEPERVVTRVSY
jgi:hypothetical protein